jgi:hypothetical protein
VQDYVNEVDQGFATQGGLFASAALLPETVNALVGFTGSVQPLDPAWFGA